MTHSQPQPKPTRDQLDLLPVLAEERGVSFDYPRTRAEAGRQIKILLEMPRSGSGERARERQALREEIAAISGGGVSVRAHELGGYGSAARWR